jgi:hypothetical protein
MSAKTEGIAPNASRLLWAGFMAILAAGVGFAIRGGILANWAAKTSASPARNSAPSAAPASPASASASSSAASIADKIGYGKLVAIACVRVPRPFRVRHLRREQRPAAGNRLQSPLLGHCSSSPMRTARSKPSPTRSSPRCSRRTARTTSTSCTPRWPAGMVLGVALQVPLVATQ